MLFVYLTLAVVEFTNSGIGVVSGQNEAGLGLGAGSLAYSRIHGQLIVVGISRHVVFQRRRTPLYRTQHIGKY